MRRRTFIQSGALFIAGCSSPIDRAAGPVTPLTEVPEIHTFKKAQQTLLKKYGVEAESRFAKLQKPALRVHVLQAGHGEPLLMLHGGGGFAAQFASLIGALQNEFRIYAPDRPGCGLTDKFDYRKTTLREHAVDFVTGVLDVLGLPEAALAGASMGGLWALQFALAQPERVTRLVLLGEPAWSPRVMTHAPPPWTSNVTHESLRAGIGARQVADIERVPDEYVDAALAARRLPGADISWNTLIEKFTRDGRGTYHLRPELKNLRPPTLFIWGESDRLGSPVLGVEMAALAPNARCEVLPAAGHLPWLDQPKRCSRSMIAFLKARP